MNQTWINGEYIPDSNACLQVSDLAIQRGYGVFDFFRLRQGKPFLLTSYLDRFFNSASELNLQVPLDKRELSTIIYEFIARNQLTDQGIKMILTGGYSEDSYTPRRPNLIIRAYEIKSPSSQKYQNGYRVMTHQYQRGTPGCKSIDYSHGISLIPTLREHGLDDVLYHSKGIISELPRSNFFLVDQQEHLITPGQKVLQGITRAVLLQLAAEHYKVEVRDVYLDELLIAKEAFLTSTTKWVMPVCEIDGRSVGSGVPGPVTRHLEKLMEKLPADFRIKAPQ